MLCTFLRHAWLPFATMMLSWFGALPNVVHVKGHRVTVSSDAADNAVAGSVVGMLKFSFEARHDHLLLLSDNEPEQYNFWRRQCPVEDVEGHLLLCRVEGFLSLPEPVPVQQFSDVRPHGLMTELEEGQADRLLRQNPALQAMCQHNAPQVLLRLPQKVATSILSSHCQRFFLPDFNKLVPTTKYTWYCAWGRLGTSEASLPGPRFNLRRQDDVDEAEYGHVSLTLLRSVTNHLRRFASEALEAEAGAAAQEIGEEGGPGAHENLSATCVYKDLCKLQKLVDELDPATVQSSIRNVNPGYVVADGPEKAIAKSAPYRAAFVIQVLLQCDLLKSDTSLKDSVKQALGLILLKSLLCMFLDMVEEHVNPSQSQISRWRLLLDAACMMQTRLRRQEDWMQGRSSVRWMMVDSSPQGGRDYELVVLGQAYLDDLQHALSLMDVMKNKSLERESYEDDEVFSAEQQELQGTLEQLLVLERPPPVVLGSGRTSLPDKFSATAHALFLETGSSDCLTRLTSEIVSCTSDLGTEFNIVRVEGAKLSELFPWFSEDMDMAEGNWPTPEPLLQFQNALAIPGALHVLHNAAKRMLTGLPELNAAVDSLATVADLLHRRHTRERLCQRCFSWACNSGL